MRFVKHLLLIAAAMIWFTISACGNDGPDETESPVSPISPQNAPAIAQSTATPVPLEIPTPSPGTSTVHGLIKSTTPETRAVLAGDIYLAAIIYTDGQHRLPFMSLDPNNDPKATLRNEANEFAIVNVPPGEYGIIVHTPISDYIVPDGEGGFRTLELQENTVIDLGLIELR